MQVNGCVNIDKVEAFDKSITVGWNGRSHCTKDVYDVAANVFHSSWKPASNSAIYYPFRIDESNQINSNNSSGRVDWLITLIINGIVCSIALNSPLST